MNSYLLNEAYYLLNQNKILESSQKFKVFVENEPVKQLLDNFNEPIILCILYELDKRLNSCPNLRKEYMKEINRDLVLKLPSPYKEFIDLMYSAKIIDKYRSDLLERLYEENLEDIGITCCYALSISEKANEENDIEKLRLSLELFKSCGSSISKIECINTYRVNTLIHLINNLSLKTEFDEIELLIKDNMNSDWLNNSMLASHVVTFSHMIKYGRNLHENLITKTEAKYKELEDNILNEKMRVFEIIGIFIALIGILGLSIHSISSQGNWNEKITFLLQSTLCMLFFVSGVKIIFEKKLNIFYKFLFCLTSLTLTTIAIYFIKNISI